MEPTTICLTILSSILFIMVLWQAWVYIKLFRAHELTAQTNRALHLIVEEYKLAEQMLNSLKMTSHSMADIVESTKILADRIAAYNENLNHLTSAVRTKVSRVDKEGLKL